MVFVNLKIVRNLAVSLFFIIFLFDIFRFTHKFIPFTDKTLLFPETKTLEFLQVNSGYNRIMTTDRRLLTPNTSIIYNLQSIDGYDPLYLNIYANIVAAWTRDKPDISPASFNRILTPEKIDSFFTDLMGVKFILSLNELTDSKYVLRFSEGQTKIYENMHVYPRVFLLEEVKILDSPQSVIEQMFHYKNDLIKIGFTSESVRIDPRILDTSEEVIISHYSPNMIKLHVNTITDRILVLTDVNYDSWHATVDNESKEILTIDYMFRGVKVPSGSHVVIFETRIW